LPGPVSVILWRKFIRASLENGYISGCPRAVAGSFSWPHPKLGKPGGAANLVSERMMRKLEQLFQRLRKIVLALAGAHQEVLEFVPSERPRFESLGWAILITSGVAAVSMWFALASAVGINGILALPIALAWGLVIMGIDRWLIVSMPADSPRKFAIAAPRLLLALLLGTLISTPLVLRIFQSEIDAQMAKMQQQNYSTFLQQQQASDVAKQVSTYSGELTYLNNVIATQGAATANTSSDPELTTYNAQLTSLNTELTHWTTLKNQYYSDYICQLYGGPTCPKKGYGPAAKASQKNYNAASSEVATLQGEINHVQGEIQQRDAQLASNSKADQQARYQQALTQQPLVKAEYDTALQRQNALQASFFASNQAAHGILNRLEALSQLSSGNFTVTAARFLIFLLFLVIECLPVTVKLMQQPGLYEEALHEAREAERKDVKKFYSFRSRLVGPGGTAVLPPMLSMEPDHRIQAIWAPARALPGSVITGDDMPTDAMDSPAPPEPPPEPGQGGQGGVYGPAGSQAREQRWFGAERWRNHWQDQPFDDVEPRVTAAGTDPFGMPRPGDMPTQPDGAHAVPDDDQDQDEPAGGQADPGQTYDAWPGERTGQETGGPTRAPAVPPGTGGTPLSWDEDE
jgi:hypothetical protein